MKSDMSNSPLDYLKHIRDEARFLETATYGKSQVAFLDDDVLKRACVRAVEIIGEASKKVSDVFRAKHPDVEWKKMAGMRDRPIHDYFGVDYYIVFDVARNKAPVLAAEMDWIIEQETAPGSGEAAH